jgi:carboxypeptidase T
MGASETGFMEGHMVRLILVLSFAVSAVLFDLTAHATETQPYWMKVTAHDKFDRTKIADTGVSLEVYGDDYVMVVGSAAQAEQLQKMGLLVAKFPATQQLLDFPTWDSDFHNYDELKAELQTLAASHASIAALDSIGKSVEGRELMRLRISKDLAHASQLPAMLLTGGHHAREHVSVEVPLMFAKRLLSLYDAGDAQAIRLIGSRDIQIVPLVNPDGAEWDIQRGVYKMWRKNRAANSDGSFGVDLNRNYSQGWNNVEGASGDPGTETFRGTSAFSEPETQAVKKWIDSTSNATTLLTLHTYSQLILYPWGSSYDPIANARDAQVFKTMAKTMSQWNGYSPMQASNLYAVSGEMCDWAYDTHKLFAFTFEMDPSSFVSDGFYPGEAKLPEIFEKNFPAIMYMIEVADNPYKVLDPQAKAFGFKTSLLSE